MKTFWWLPFGRVPAIPPDELAGSLDQRPPPQLIDVRTPTEFVAGHIRSARNVPITAFRSRLPELDLDPVRPVYVICLSAHRSRPAVRLLLAKGFDARELAGGMRSWRAAGLPEAS
jgi:rhodanese-related sulfurtransferase